MLYGPNRSITYSAISLPLAFVQAGAVPTAPGGAFSTAGLFAAASNLSPADLASGLPSSSAILFAPQVVILRVNISPGSKKALSCSPNPLPLCWAQASPAPLSWWHWWLSTGHLLPSSGCCRQRWRAAPAQRWLRALPQHEKRTQAGVCVRTRVSVHTDGCLQACGFACVCIHKCPPVGTRGLGVRVSKDMV